MNRSTWSQSEPHQQEDTEAVDLTPSWFPGRSFFAQKSKSVNFKPKLSEGPKYESEHESAECHCAKEGQPYPMLIKV